MELSQVVSLWWVFLVSVAIATVALSTGISGALFFSPSFCWSLGWHPLRPSVRD